MVQNLCRDITILSDDQLFKLIITFMNVTEEKIIDKLMGVYLQTTLISAATYHKLQTLVSNQSPVNVLLI